MVIESGKLKKMNFFTSFYEDVYIVLKTAKNAEL